MNKNYIDEIDELLVLLQKYKNDLQENNNMINQKLITLIDNDLYNVKDKILLFFGSKKMKILDPKLIEEIDEYENTMNNIKDIYPIILNYLVFNNSIN